MAVPKKRTSKRKRNIRRYHWKHKAVNWKQKALSYGLRILDQPS
jgi:large subunit ribosomal protein L32